MPNRICMSLIFGVYLSSLRDHHVPRFSYVSASVAAAAWVRINETRKVFSMWLCTTVGFFSVVRKGRPPNNFQVRSRTRLDIENLCDLIKLPHSRIVTTHDSDYEFRVLLDEYELGRMFDALQTTVTYRNFKGAVGGRPNQRQQCETYHKWWHDHARWQVHPPYSGSRKRQLSPPGEPSAPNEYDPPKDAVV